MWIVQITKPNHLAFVPEEIFHLCFLGPLGYHVFFEHRRAHNSARVAGPQEVLKYQHLLCGSWKQNKTGQTIKTISNHSHQPKTCHKMRE